MSKEIRILVDIRVQFYVRSSGTFDEFVVCTLPEKKNFSFIYIHTYIYIYIYIYIHKQLKNHRIKLSIRYTRSYIFSLFSSWTGPWLLYSTSFVYALLLLLLILLLILLLLFSRHVIY